jgi:RimJ/RimL family protein N-acetyltransferase
MEFTDGVVQFRAIEPCDLELLRQWINDPETARYLSISWPISSKEQNIWFERLSSDLRRKKLLIELVKGEPVGVLSLMNIDFLNRNVEIGITIGSAEHRSKGLASRSLCLALKILFEYFNYHRVWAQILEINQTSLNLFAHIGFRTEGTLRENVYWEGRMVNTVVVSILQHEYNKLSSVGQFTK